MLSDQFIAELGIALQAQNHVLKNLDLAVSEIDAKLTEAEQKLSDVDETTNQLRDLESLMEALEASQEWIETEDFGDFDPNQILRLYENRQQSVFRELTKIGFKDWDSFVRQCQTYALSQGVDSLAPYEGFLTEADLKKIQSESYDAQYQWDACDYSFVGASGILALLTDVLLVQIPKNPTVIGNGKWLDQLNLTARLKDFNTTAKAGQTDWFSQWARSLEKACNVPYDNQNLISGMSKGGHRIQSMGHDPVLGFVFGILDIMRGTITGFSYDKLSGTHSWTCVANPEYQSIKLIEAILCHIGHLISDVATPMGLPAPFMTLLQGINIGSFNIGSTGDKRRTVGELARWMYLNGYDFRHFLVSGITPAVIEIVLRAYIMLRHYSEHGETKFDLASHPKYRSMLLAAHSMATVGNAGKIILMQGNPLAINSAEWMAFVRYLVPSIKYWVFDQRQLRLEHLEQINATGWNDLLQGSDQLMATLTEVDFPTIPLGTT
ncbi:MAG: hypothetical protein DCF22_15615 [Leptolyngbya sp.]|nr:MAG: hypothetical protein DCF22_15615 [Leptolyngbya sp.]